MHSIDRKILIVDDDEMIRESLRAVFEEKGLQVLTAVNVAKGLEEAVREEPDVIITDLEIGSENGIDLLKHLRNEGGWGEKVPVIVLTNFNADDQMMAEINSYHSSLFIVKSKSTPAEILSKVENLLETIKT